jgi:hypothetical protein
MAYNVILQKQINAPALVTSHGAVACASIVDRPNLNVQSSHVFCTDDVLFCRVELAT